MADTLLKTDMDPGLLTPQDCFSLQTSVFRIYVSFNGVHIMVNSGVVLHAGPAERLFVTWDQLHIHGGDFERHSPLHRLIPI